MKLKDIKLDKSNKAFKFNTKVTFISVLFIIAFYFFPAFQSFKNMPYWFLIGFILLPVLLLFGAKIYFFYFILYLFFLAGFISSILLTCYSIKNIFLKIVKMKALKYLIYLIFQFLFSIGLIYFGVSVFIRGTPLTFETPINETPRIYYPEPMIFAIIITVITLFQLIHFIYILRKELKKQNF